MNRTVLDTLKAALRAEDIRPQWPATLPPGAPICSDVDCPSYDGKRCRASGFQPGRVCEPAADRMVERLAELAEVTRG